VVVVQIVYPFLWLLKEMEGKKKQPCEGFSISLTSNDQEETSAIAAVSSLSFFGKRN
jgi:hypothetical protein